MTTRALALVLSLGLLFVAACSEETSDPGIDDPIPCGIRVCAVDETDNYDPSSLPAEDALKSDAVDRVNATLVDLSGDGTIDASDVEKLFDAAGGKVSKGEILALFAAIHGEDLDYEVEGDALALADQKARVHNMDNPDEIEIIHSGFAISGTELPKAVSELVLNARWHGAVAFDVNETDDDGEQIWTPYPATTPATENMAWDYTQLTPEALAEDLAATDLEYNKIVGTETATTASGQEYMQARYEPGKGGTGNVMAHYDEVYHPDIYARGRSGQKWANNFAILSDGTIHALPAARRSFKQDLILTNPHLSRGARMMYNGHLDIRGGVVTGVEMSGRLSKLVGKGKATIIDPIALLEAWGFEISDNVTLRFGNTEDGVPVTNELGGVLESPKE